MNDNTEHRNIRKACWNAQKTGNWACKVKKLLLSMENRAFYRFFHGSVVLQETQILFSPLKVINLCPWLVELCISPAALCASREGVVGRSGQILHSWTWKRGFMWHWTTYIHAPVLTLRYPDWSMRMFSGLRSRYMRSRLCIYSKASVTCAA